VIAKKLQILIFAHSIRIFVAMQLRKLKGILSWFFISLLAVGMADFSLHVLTHEHAQSHQLEHVDCDHVTGIQKGAKTISASEKECVICGHFVMHTVSAVTDLADVPETLFSAITVSFPTYQLISNKLPSAFLRGPPAV